MVWTFRPPGVSSALANSRRATARCAGPETLPVASLDLLVKRCVIERGPLRERIEYASCHVGCGGFGEGDAKDLRGICAAQQQVDHALDQHMCLAGTGIGGDEHRALGIGGRNLRSPGGIRNLASGSHGSTSLSPPEADHSLTRARWS